MCNPFIVFLGVAVFFGVVVGVSILITNKLHAIEINNYSKIPKFKIKPMKDGGYELKQKFRKFGLRSYYTGYDYIGVYADVEEARETITNLSRPIIEIFDK